MRKKIDVRDLRVGMFVCGLERSWFHTPFLTHSFRIKNRKQIEKIREADIRHVYIDTEKGLDTETEQRETKDDRDFISIPSKSIKPRSIIPFTLYVDMEGKKAVFLSGGMTFEEESSDILSRRGISTLYISKDEEGAYADYVGKTGKGRGSVAGHEEAVRDYSLNKEMHYPVAKDLLLPGSEIDFPLYHKDGFTIKPLVNTDGKGAIKVLESFLDVPGDIVIRKTDIPKYREYLSGVLKDKSRRKALKTRITRENAKLTVESLFENPRSGEMLRKTEDVVQEMIDEILQNRGAFLKLLTLNTHDSYTYVHSVNVATFSIALGKAIRLDENAIFELGLGSILHDLGKSRIPHEILNKPGRLTPEEVGVMRQHVLYGRDILQQHSDIPEDSFIPLLQHHEVLSGKGYPFGLQGGELKLYGRIASIVDIYDALTTDRPYKKAYPPFYALSIIGNAEKNYDLDIYNEFVLMLGNIV